MLLIPISVAAVLLAALIFRIKSKYISLLVFAAAAGGLVWLLL